MASHALMGVGIQAKPENLDVTFLEGYPSLPLIVFIHGLGMDKNIWLDPSQSKIMAGNVPLSVLLRSKPRPRIMSKDLVQVEKITLGTSRKALPSLLRLLHGDGYPVLAWSQKRPLGPSEIILDELNSLLKLYDRYLHSGLILIGHSRGGLAAWNYTLLRPENIKAVVTIGTPFYGSSLAQWANLLSKVTVLLSPVLPKSEGGKVKNSIKKIKDFIESTAVKELLPGSPFLDKLKYPIKPGTSTLCIAGSDPTFFKLYKWRKSCINNDMCNSHKYRLEPALLFSFPGSIGGVLPQELSRNKGDGLVAKTSAVHAHCDKSAVVALNHVRLLFSHSVNKMIRSFLRDLPEGR